MEYKNKKTINYYMDILIHGISGLILMKMLGVFSWYGIIFSIIPDLIGDILYIIHRVFVKRDLKYRGLNDHQRKPLNLTLSTHNQHFLIQVLQQFLSDNNSLCRVSS